MKTSFKKKVSDLYFSTTPSVLSQILAEADKSSNAPPTKFVPEKN